MVLTPIPMVLNKVSLTVLTRVRIIFSPVPSECPSLSCGRWVLRGKGALAQTRHRHAYSYTEPRGPALLPSPASNLPPHTEGNSSHMGPVHPAVRSYPCDHLLTWSPACPSTPASCTQHQRDLSKLRSDHFTPPRKAAHGGGRPLRALGLQPLPLGVHLSCREQSAPYTLKSFMALRLTPAVTSVLNALLGLSSSELL